MNVRWSSLGDALGILLGVGCLVFVVLLFLDLFGAVDFSWIPESGQSSGSDVGPPGGSNNQVPVRPGSGGSGGARGR